MATRASTVQITMPQMGESVTEGTVVSWLKQVGDRVEADEAIVEVTTDKVDAEVPAPAAGTLTRILAEPDQTVQVGEALGEIETGGDGEPAATPEATPPDEPSETVDVAFPEMGDSVAEGTVLEWRVKPGDTVAVDDVLVEISTDKVDAEVPAPVAGTVEEILVEPDQTVQVGAVLCRIAAGDGAPAGPVQPAAEPTSEPAATSDPAPAANGGNATPVAARIAGAHGLDPSSLEGTGPRGRVTKHDVLAAIEGNGAPASDGAPAPAEEAATEPIRGPAATLVRYMNESRGIPTATSFRSVPVDALDARRKELKAAGKRLSFTHLIAWAIVSRVARLAGDGARLRRGGRQAAARGARRGQPRPGRGRGAKGRQPLARRPGARGRRRDGLRRVRRALRRAGGRSARQHARGRTPTAEPPSRSPTRAAWARWPRCRA